MSLFKIQPECCRQPLEPRPLMLRGRLAPVIERVVAYDPQPAFERIADTADPLKRIQVRSNISLQQLFPKKKNGYCDCGCGQALTGRQTRWAAPACSEFVWYVYAIIAGRRQEIRRCLKAYYGRTCTGCGKMPPKYTAVAGRTRSGMETDHIIPVHKGGGACWLSNYRPLCVSCHRQKTSSNRREAMKAPLV
jgi:5-methylcytosine-specific restriction endonuclease McrA